MGALAMIAANGVERHVIKLWRFFAPSGRRKKFNLGIQLGGQSQNPGDIWSTDDG